MSEHEHYRKLFADRHPWNIAYVSPAIHAKLAALPPERNSLAMIGFTVEADDRVPDDTVVRFIDGEMDLLELMPI